MAETFKTKHGKKEKEEKATRIESNLVIVTKNVSHFKRMHSIGRLDKIGLIYDSNTSCI
jgi:hypothetical protein